MCCFTYYAINFYGKISGFGFLEFYSSNCTDVARALCPKQIILSDSVRLSEPVEKRLVFSHHPKLSTQMFWLSTSNILHL